MDLSLPIFTPPREHSVVGVRKRDILAGGVERHCIIQRDRLPAAQANRRLPSVVEDLGETVKRELALERGAIHLA
jgi:hypothetical protein